MESANGPATLQSQSGLGIDKTVSQPSGSSGPPSNAKLRKRTKTGCLTCRKRRIKCGEERPTCNNCAKSRRHCEGYSQRVIFKPTLSEWPMAPQPFMAAVPYNTAYVPGTRQIYHPHPSQAGVPVPLQPIQPRPPGQYDLPTLETTGLTPIGPYSGPPLSAGAYPTEDLHYVHYPNPAQHPQPPLSAPPYVTTPVQGTFPPPQSVPETTTAGEEQHQHYAPHLQQYSRDQPHDPHLQAQQVHPPQPQHIHHAHPQQAYQQQQIPPQALPSQAQPQPVQTQPVQPIHQSPQGQQHSEPHQYPHQQQQQQQQQHHQPYSPVQLHPPGQQYGSPPQPQQHPPSTTPEIRYSNPQNVYHPSPNIPHTRPESQPPQTSYEIQNRHVPAMSGPPAQTIKYETPVAQQQAYVGVPNTQASAAGLVMEQQQIQRLYQEQVPRQGQGQVIQTTKPAVTQAVAGSHATNDPNEPPQNDVEQFYGRLATSGFDGDRPSPTQFLNEAAIEYQDDDYYDVFSDEEMEDSPDRAMVVNQKSQGDFGEILAVHRQYTSEIGLRRYDQFITEGVLDQYKAEWTANPLRNPKTARVFAHFVHATGPSLSIYERHTRNTSAMFAETPVPASQQSLWTYKLPMMALHHQGLLHAMLALASLHIAKLQNASVTPSLKHYAYAIKRIHRCLANRNKRHQIPTVAASLLLGFYEVMTADHLKWSTHLVGAKLLLAEIDYLNMTKEYRKAKTEQAADDQPYPYHLQQPRQNQFAPKEPELLADEGLVSTITGRSVSYEEFGYVEEMDGRRRTSFIPQPMDMGRYELYQDLFWWFVRQDAYQSIISGNRLLMDYTRWANCPPRAPCGKPDAIYATHDHLVLLLGRIADFSARDRYRKIKAMEANGGVWRPPQGPNPFGPPPSNAMGPPPVAPPRTGPCPTPSPVTPMGPPPTFPPRNPQNPLMTLPGASPSFPPKMANLQGTGTPLQQGPGQMPPSPAGGPPGPPRGPPQGPTFYGMAPGPQQVPVPSSYTRNKPASPSPGPQSPSDFDLGKATSTALEEWRDIQRALAAFQSTLGPAYAPLSPEYQAALPTPFGDARQYRSYDIGVLWALFYMCHIIAVRSHPSMPPAAMMAAGVAAQQTEHFAQEIGRICAGIVPGESGPNVPLNPSLGAALVESCMPLFFAGVQYTNLEQRQWLVSRVRDIEARTGFSSAGLIASGCETSWERAAQMGRGPPYVRVRDRGSHDDRIAGRIRRTDEERNQPVQDQSDRRWIWTVPAARVHWAIGLLSEEQDLMEGEMAE